MSQTYEEYLLETQQEIPEQVNCPECGKLTRPFALVRHPSFSHDFVCGHCIIDHDREVLAKNYVVPIEEQWNQVKSDRNKLLEAAAWTISPASPLTEACQQQFVDYIKTLHRITVDFQHPDDVIFPPRPTYEYQ